MNIREILRVMVEFLAAALLALIWLMALQGVQAAQSVPLTLSFIYLPFGGIAYYWGALRRSEKKNKS